MNTNQSVCPRVILPVPGHDNLTVCVYGVARAGGLREQMEQAFFVALDGKPTARAELDAPQKEAVFQLLSAKYPEHARV